jgi:hypothetical protein
VAKWGQDRRHAKTLTLPLSTTVALFKHRAAVALGLGAWSLITLAAIPQGGAGGGAILQNEAATLSGLGIQDGTLIRLRQRAARY